MTTDKGKGKVKIAGVVKTKNYHLLFWGRAQHNACTADTRPLTLLHGACSCVSTFPLYEQPQESLVKEGKASRSSFIIFICKLRIITK